MDDMDQKLVGQLSKKTLNIYLRAARVQVKYETENSYQNEAVEQFSIITEICMQVCSTRLHEIFILILQQCLFINQ